MTDHDNAPPPATPGRELPLLHALFALVAVGLLYAPLVELGDGGVWTLMDIGGAWAMATLIVLALLGIAALLLIAADRVTWARLLVVDMLIVIALIPVVVGVVINWEAPVVGVAGFGWGFWAAIALLVARFPLSIWIRTHAARAQAQLQHQDTDQAGGRGE
ncbi:hypothetical protein HC341_05345 [Aquisalimonas sp. 2447]|uniref:hypothetical protein n=1 Tax=Aquisalimonas sp. 2447 TaxID=2740807 RepID=UPI0014323C8A|nr:hypothetical protein [Aquisalimonas sp. 2447]QIT54693.1 hypothetical protein HC341_05345 [Aquisalimonas sp. 2447]